MAVKGQQQLETKNMTTLYLAKPIHRSPLRRPLLLIAPALIIVAAWTAVPARATPSSGFSTEFILSPGCGLPPTNPNGNATFDVIEIYAKWNINYLHPNLPPDWWKAMLSTNKASDLYVVRNTIAPGGTSGWHTHPGFSLVTVTSGTITVYDGDDPTCTPQHYSAGSTFIDPTSNGHLHLVRNETGTTAVTVAVQLVPQGLPRRIDKGNPGYCPNIN
jgi:quercetin dioxygenase-like cupin family protein